MGQHEEDQGFLIRLVLSVWYEDSSDWAYPTQRVAIVSHKLPILRRTPKGVWIKDLNNKDRFVLLEGTKRYAYPTIQAAFDSFIVRKVHERAALERRVKALSKLPQANELRKQLFDKLIASSNGKIQL